MPQVPTYPEDRVREQPLQGGFQQAPDVTQGARSVAQGLGAVSEVADRMARRDAEAAANTVDQTVATEWLKWSAENSNKFTGENAAGYAPAAEQWWKTASQTYGATLDPMAKRLATESISRKQTSAMGNVYAHVEQQKEIHADQAASANIATTLQFGVTSGDVEGAANQVRKIVSEIGARKGWDTKQVQSEFGKQLSNLHLSWITKLASDRPDVAQAYYNDHKKEVVFTQQAHVEDVLRKETDNQQAAKFAAQWADLPLAKQLSNASAINRPELMHKTLVKVKENYALVKEAEVQTQKENSDLAWYLTGKGKAVPEEVLARMEGHDSSKLQEFVQRRAEHRAMMADKPVRTNPAALVKVYDMMRDDPEGFKKLRMQSLAYSLAGSDIEQVARIQRDMLMPDKERDVATTQQQLHVATAKWQPEKKALFEAAAYNEFNEHKVSNKGQPPNFEQRRAIIDRLLLDGEVRSGSWYLNDPNKKFYEASAEERSRFVPEISDENKALIVKSLARSGILKPTDEQIMARFKLAKGLQ